MTNRTKIGTCLGYCEARTYDARIRELEAELAVYREPIPGVERTWRSRAEKAEAREAFLGKELHLSTMEVHDLKARVAELETAFLGLFRSEFGRDPENVEKVIHSYLEEGGGRESGGQAAPDERSGLEKGAPGGERVLQAAANPAACDHATTVCRECADEPVERECGT